MNRGRVSVDGIDTTPQSFTRFEGSEELGTHPPQWPACGMLLHDSTTRQYEIPRIGSEVPQRRSRLGHQFGGIGIPGACQIPQVLDGMHFSQRSAGLLPFHPWQIPPPQISSSRP